MDRTVPLLYKSNMASPTAILNFNLFGESDELPDVVHCETIAARSAPYDWEFAPHRHARLHQILLIESGSGRASLDGADHKLGPMTLINVPIGQVHSFSFAPGTGGVVVTLAAETLQSVLTPADDLQQILATPQVIDANPQCVATIRTLAQTFAGRDFARTQLLRSLAGLLLGQTARAIFESGHVPSAAPLPALVTDFEALLEQHYLEHWTVERYARALAVSPTHLSRVTRKVTGQPATRLIRDRLMLEARRNLVYTSMPINRIAYALGFRDPAYFTRVFSRATGIAPQDFRRRAE